MAELEAILGPLGYRYNRIDEERPLGARERIEGDTSYAHMIWLFTPSGPDHDFWRLMPHWGAMFAAFGDNPTPMTMS